MALKCIRKFSVVMIELLILIILKVQANDLAHFSFHLSSAPIQLSYFSKLDKVQNHVLAPTSLSLSPIPIIYHPHFIKLDEVQETIHTCLANKIRACEGMHRHGTNTVRICI
jgi:hypothetical protein